MPPGALLGEEVHGRAGLLKGDPEEDVEEGQDGDGGNATPVVRRKRRVGWPIPRRGSARGLLANAGQVALLEDQVCDQACHHAHPGRAKAPVPAEALALGQIAADDGAQRRSGVDPHVEDGEGRIATPVAGLVELPHHGRDVGLEESGSQNDEGKPEEKRRPAGHRQAEVARGDHDAANDEGAVGAQESISQVAAEQRSQVDQPGVPAVKIGRLLLGPTESASRADQKQHQECPHPVVGEALPHLDPEQQKKPGRLSICHGEDLLDTQNQDQAHVLGAQAIAHVNAHQRYGHASQIEAQAHARRAVQVLVRLEPLAEQAGWQELATVGS